MRETTFADANYSDVVPVIRNGSTTGSEPGVTFQSRPSLQDCKPYLAQTPHEGGMLIGLGDGSVRTISPSVSPQIYWGAVTPAGGEVLTGDW